MVMPFLYAPVPKTQFKKDVKLAKRRGKNLAKLDELLQLLCAGLPLPAKNREHTLSGDWSGYRECHIEPDWLLIYVVVENDLILVRTGSHADLFD